MIAQEAEAADVDLFKSELGADEDAALDDISTKADVTFDPIDVRFLSSLPVVRSRVIKLLLASPHHTHPAHNLMTRIVSSFLFYGNIVLKHIVGIHAWPREDRPSLLSHSVA